MRTLTVILLALAAPPAGRADPAPAVETAWLVKSRLGNRFPRIGRLCHASVILCPPGVPPVIIGADGELATNPACFAFGTQPGNCGFLRETTQRTGGVCCESATLPAAEVWRRVAHDHRRWRIWYNCQHAAAEATGHALGPDDDRPPTCGLLHRLWMFLVGCEGE